MKENNIVVGGKYKHYKGNVYAVMAVGRNSENPEEELVVYQGQYDDPKFGHNQIWIRPKKMFLETVRVNGRTIPRFQFIENSQ